MKNDEVPHQHQGIRGKMSTQWNPTNRRFIRNSNSIVDTSGMEIEREKVNTSNNFNALREDVEERGDTSGNLKDQRSTKGWVTNPFYKNEPQSQDQKSSMQVEQDRRDNKGKEKIQRQDAAERDILNNTDSKLEVNDNVKRKQQGQMAVVVIDQADLQNQAHVINVKNTESKCMVVSKSEIHFTREQLDEMVEFHSPLQVENGEAHEVQMMDEGEQQISEEEQHLAIRSAKSSEQLVNNSNNTNQQSENVLTLTGAVGANGFNQEIASATKHNSPNKILHDLISHQSEAKQSSGEEENNQNEVYIEDREEEESNVNLSQVLQEAGVSHKGN